MASNALHFFIGLASFEMLAMFRRGLFYAYLSIYLRHYFGLSVTETTLFATLPMAVNVMAQTFVWGKISDRLQKRRTLIIVGELLAAAGTIVIWAAHRRFADPVAAGYTIIFGLTLVEIFWSMSNISWSALVSDLYAEKDRSRIQGRLSSMGGIGRMAGVWVGGLLYDGLGLKYAGWGFFEGSLFFVAAGVMFISTLPLLLLPEGGIRFKPAGDRSDAEPIRAGTSDAYYVMFLVGMTFIHFGRNSIAIIFAQYLSLDSGLALSSQTLAHVINTQSVAMVALGWLVGWLCRHLGNETVLLSGTTIGILALMLLYFSTALPIVFFSSFLRGISDVVILASSYTIASVLIPPRRRGQLFAWFNGTFFLSFGLGGTLIAGPVVDLLIRAGYAQANAYQVSFAVAAGLTAIGLLIQIALLAFFKARWQTA